MGDYKIVFDNISATQFADVWKQFDLDQSGEIKGQELEGFFYELAKSTLHKEPTQREFDKIKKTFSSVYLSEPKISINRLAEIMLPKDEAFLLFFRRRVPLESSVTFMWIWRKYDRSCDGYIDAKELKSFVSDYIAAAGASVTKEKLKEYTNSIMKIFDTSGDGKLDLQEMARLLNLSENFLLQYKIQDGSPKERRKNFEKIFKHYDESESGALEGAEIDGFVKDMIETLQGSVTAPEVDSFKKKMLKHTDTNKDGNMQKSELALFLGVRLT